MPAPVLILLGLLILFAAVPSRARLRMTSTPALAGAVVVLVLLGLLTVLVRSVNDRSPGATAPTAVDERGVCADPAVHPRCTALLIAASPVVDLLNATPSITSPGSGRLVLSAQASSTQPRQLLASAIEAALTAGGWSAVRRSAALTSYRRGELTAALTLEDAGAGTTVRLSVSD